MRGFRLALVTVSLGLLLAGCSVQSDGTPSETPSVIPSAAAPVDCAVADDSGRVEVPPLATCAQVPTGSIALFYSLASDVIDDARIEVKSGNPRSAVPLSAPEADGGFLMGILAEEEGVAEVAVYVTPSDGSGELLVQELTVTSAPAAD